MSPDPKDILMQSHYANKHEGYCLEFDREILYERYPDDMFYLVEYSDAYPKTKKSEEIFNLLPMNFDNPDLKKIVYYGNLRFKTRGAYKIANIYNFIHYYINKFKLEGLMQYGF